MTATKMNAQEIIQFIANAEKKTSVKVTFEGQLTGSIPASVTKLGNVLFGDWKDIAPLLEGLTENKDYVVEQDARNSAVPLLDKRDINARIEPGAIVTQDVPENVVVAGVPARVIKEIDSQTQQKTALEDALRTL